MRNCCHTSVRGGELRRHSKHPLPQCSCPQTRLHAGHKANGWFPTVSDKKQKTDKYLWMKKKNMRCQAQVKLISFFFPRISNQFQQSQRQREKAVPGAFIKNSNNNDIFSNDHYILTVIT